MIMLFCKVRHLMLQCLHPSAGFSCKSVFVDPDLHLRGSDRVLQISCCTILTRVYQVVYFRYSSRCARLEFIHPPECNKSHLGIKLFRFGASIKYCTLALCDNCLGVELQAVQTY